MVIAKSLSITFRNIIQLRLNDSNVRVFGRETEVKEKKNFLTGDVNAHSLYFILLLFWQRGWQTQKVLVLSVAKYYNNILVVIIKM